MTKDISHLRIMICGPGIIYAGIHESISIRPGSTYGAENDYAIRKHPQIFLDNSDHAKFKDVEIYQVEVHTHGSTWEWTGEDSSSGDMSQLYESPDEE